MSVTDRTSLPPAIPRDRITWGLEEARRRTLALLDLPPADQVAQFSEIMSPMVWDLAHVGNYEELWLLGMLDGRAPLREGLGDLYDAFAHPRRERPSLGLLDPGEARAYIAEVRREVLALLDRLTLDDRPTDDGSRLDGTRARLLHHGFVYGMVIQHEQQHAETLLATRQLMGERASPPPGSVPVITGHPPLVHTAEVLMPGGCFEQGTSLDPWAYDNEQPVHEVQVSPFWLDTTPVTNAAFSRFIGEGGYDDPRWWDSEGWSWSREETLSHPRFWRPVGSGTGGDWEVLRFGTWRALDPDEPVQHVSWYEADAYARWAGRRLPTETEWELAATSSPGRDKARYPWGDDDPTPRHANLGQRHDGPAPVGSHQAGANPWGVHQLIGDVWEWTSTDFRAYPGFESFPYREYSEAFFPSATGAGPGPTPGPSTNGRPARSAGTGRLGYKVLRGGSWATHPVAVRGTFRNWDHPIRSQIFAGFRTARDGS